MEKEVKQKSFGVSFAGGGVHGWAELAVYEELEKQNIQIDAVTGTSMGSFIAAAVASGLTTEQIKSIIEETDQVIQESKLFNRRTLLNLFSFRQPMGLVLMEKIMKVIEPISAIYGELMLSDVPTPLAIPAVDLHTGKMIVFSNAPEYFELVFEHAEFYEKDLPLVDACLASSAYPVVLSPVRIDDYQLIDGGVILNAPAALISKKKIEYVLSIDVVSTSVLEPVDKWGDVAFRTIEILKNHQRETTEPSIGADYRLELDLPGTFDFGDSGKIIEAGREFVRENPVDLSDVFVEVRQAPPITIQKPVTFREKVQAIWKGLKRNS